MKSLNYLKMTFLCCCLSAGILVVPLQAEPLTGGRNAESEGYVANKDGLKIFFDALSSRLGKPVIVSKLAARKNISGEFDFSHPQELLERISRQLGLIWYHDGQAIYVYDASEMRNSVMSLRNTSFSALTQFLRNAQLLDNRFPLRGDDNSGTFYISGPPIYVDLVLNTAKFMDDQPELANGSEKTAVIHLSNTFVGDRSYDSRGEKVVIPGIATVIDQLLRGGSKNSGKETQPQVLNMIPDGMTPPSMPEFNLDNIAAKSGGYQPRASLAEALRAETGTSGAISVIANPDTNSLLVKGTARQVQLVTNLVSSLDTAKRHVELSLWIVDLQKEDLDQLGVDWRGGVNIGNQLSATFNQGSYSTLDGNRFVASVQALSQKKRAEIVSRPVVLTQENVPAIFDNNRTFYTKLIGERTVDLQHVTYGTMVSVLPRFSADGQIEMVLNIEDGNEIAVNQASAAADNLPKVGRTHISTVARVPKGKSLLIGGYTRDENTGSVGKIPLLGNLPLVGGMFRHKIDSQSNTVRIFLIQPREITEPLTTDASQFAQRLINSNGPGQLPDWSRNYLDSQKWR